MLNKWRNIQTVQSCSLEPVVKAKLSGSMLFVNQFHETTRFISFSTDELFFAKGKDLTEDMLTEELLSFVLQEQITYLKFTLGCLKFTLCTEILYNQLLLRSSFTFRSGQKLIKLSYLNVSHLWCI